MMRKNQKEKIDRLFVRLRRKKISKILWNGVLNKFFVFKVCSYGVVEICLRLLFFFLNEKKVRELSKKGILKERIHMEMSSFIN